MTYAIKVAPKEKLNVAKIDPADTRGVNRKKADQLTVELSARLAELQELLYGSACHSVLIVLQGLDTSGKDGTISHVMSHVNPASCRVEPFKAPTPDELAHDFLWRIHRVTPPKGSMAIFNRSHYEDVLVARVHNLVERDVWRGRYTHINNFESLLASNETLILKFFLHISKNEQQERLLAREKDPDKAWKLSLSDWPEHELYNDYMNAYEDALSRCSSENAPWYIVPADHKWYRNLAVAEAIVTSMELHEKQWRTELEKRGKTILQQIKQRQVQ